MKGFKTIALNAASALGVAALTWVAGYDWHGAGATPAVAIIVTNIANIGLRFVTNSSVFSKY